jgi:hypothetical protein
MNNTAKQIGLIVVAIFAAGAILNLLANIAQTKQVAGYITKGYGAA